MAEDKRTFEGVTQATWERIQSAGQNDHGTVFERQDELTGTATTPTPVGPVVLGFEFEPEGERITYTILKKPMLAPSSLIWGGIAAAIERFRNT